MYEVHLADKGVQVFPPVDFTESEMVSKLLLSNNRGIQFTEHLKAFISLKELSVWGCALQDLPEVFQQLKQLQCLDVSHNELSSLPSTLVSLTMLQRLDLTMNALRNLPDVVCSLATLEELIVCGCCLQSLPSELSQLKQLKHLDVSQNLLSSLPDSFRNLRLLHTLIAWNNNFTEYPAVLLQVGSLRKVEFKNMNVFFGAHGTNSITELPVGLQHCTLLENLDLIRNPMVYPPEEICGQGIAAVRRYLSDASSGVAEVCMDTISTLGDTSAGKTSVVESLKRGLPFATEEANRTHIMEQGVCKLINNVQVMVNDFGGHEVYHSVLPVLLPPTGVGAIVYDISRTTSEREASVSNWLDTVFAKSPQMHCIIIATHCDMVSDEDVLDRMKGMDKFVASKIARYVNEHRDHVDKLNYQMTRCQKQNCRRLAEFLNCKVQVLEKFLTHFKSIEIVHTSVSCRPRDGCSDGLEKLNRLLCEALSQPAKVPASWCRVIKDILLPTDSVLYLKMQDVRKIFFKVFPAEEVNEERVKVILTYLAATCQILWLKDHPTLGNVVFHRMDELLRMCKAVLHHDEMSALSVFLSTERYTDAMQLYTRGLIDEQFLDSVLACLSDKNCSDDFKRLLTEFNLIREVYNKGSVKLFFIPSLLLEEEPEEENETRCICASKVKVHAQISLTGSLTPAAFFATNLAVIVKQLNLHQVQPRLWKHGVVFNRNQVAVSCRRVCHGSRHVLDITAESVDIRKLWSVLHPILIELIRHVTTTWQGVMCVMHLICPSCEFNGRTAGDARKFFIDLDPDSLERLVTTAGDIYHASDEEPDDVLWCSLCKTNIPRTLVDICSKDKLTDDDCQRVKEYWCTHGTQRSALSTAVQPNLQQGLLKTRSLLVEKCGDVVVDTLVVTLYSSLVLTLYEKEAIEAERPRFRKVMMLLDIMEKKDSPAIQSFLAALSLEGQKWLADAVLKAAES